MRLYNGIERPDFTPEWITGLKADEIGRIDVKDRYAYVAIRREKLKQTLHLVQGQKIKGIKTIVEEVR